MEDTSNARWDDDALMSYVVLAQTSRGEQEMLIFAPSWEEAERLVRAELGDDVVDVRPNIAPE